MKNRHCAKNVKRLRKDLNKLLSPIKKRVDNMLPDKMKELSFIWKVILKIRNLDNNPKCEKHLLKIDTTLNVNILTKIIFNAFLSIRNKNIESSKLEGELCHKILNPVISKLIKKKQITVSILERVKYLETACNKNIDLAFEDIKKFNNVTMFNSFPETLFIKCITLLTSILNMTIKDLKLTSMFEKTTQKIINNYLKLLEFLKKVLNFSNYTSIMNISAQFSSLSMTSMQLLILKLWKSYLSLSFFNLVAIDSILNSTSTSISVNSFFSSKESSELNNIIDLMEVIKKLEEEKKAESITANDIAGQAGGPSFGADGYVNSKEASWFKDGEDTIKESSKSSWFSSFKKLTKSLETKSMFIL